LVVAVTQCTGEMCTCGKEIQECTGHRRLDGRSLRLDGSQAEGDPVRVYGINGLHELLPNRGVFRNPEHRRSNNTKSR
jgi:hypothetical protein